MEKSFDTLINPKKFKTDNVEYYVGKIPAFFAQRILLSCGGELDITTIPEQVILDLLSYAAVVNKHGVPVVLDGIEIINMMVEDPKVLLAIEVSIIEENFRFFYDGSLKEIFKPLIEMVQGSREEKAE
jgi:hypothetical protein